MSEAAEARDRPVSVDFAPYDVAGGAPRAFVAQRFHNPASGQPVGTVVVAIGASFVDAALATVAGSYLDIQTYVVGSDGFLRSDQATRLSGRGPRESLDRSRLTGTGLLHLTSRDGEPLVAVGREVRIGDNTWLLWLAKPHGKAFAVMRKLDRAILVSALTVIGPLLILALLMGLSVTRPIAGLAEALAGIGAGRTDLAIPGSRRRDEIGAIAASVARIRENLLRDERERLREREEREHEASAQRSTLLADLASDLERSVLGRHRGRLGGGRAAERHRPGTVRRREPDAGERHHRPWRGIARCRQHPLDRGRRPATAPGDRPARRRRAVLGPVGPHGQGSRRCDGQRRRGLAAGAARVSDVIGLISDIADQTNLLALNATIEAAARARRGAASPSSPMR